MRYFTEHEEKRPKPKDTLAEDARKARRIGLSYGQYIAKMESGCLEEYIANRMQEKSSGEKVNEIRSNIIGA